MATATELARQPPNKNAALITPVLDSPEGQRKTEADFAAFTDGINWRKEIFEAKTGEGDLLPSGDISTPVYLTAPEGKLP